MTLIRKLFVSILFFFVALTAYTQSYSIRGRVCEERKNTPITGAVLRLGEDYLWTMTDAQGGFVFENVQAGQYEIEISCLGYVTIKKPLTLQQDVNELVFKLSENSLALDEVLVTAKRSDGLNTSHNLGRDALNHLQVTSLTDISSLLPGGKTVNPDLTTANSFSLRSGGSTMGNAAFGTAVEVDGVRIGNNASFGEMKGVNTRSVAVENIESVELITGVPSAEYGDMNSGVVKIHTRKGYTPVNITFSINPRTYQASASKGIDLQKDRGILNVSAEWARSVKKLVSPYSSYSRAGFSAVYSNSFKKNLRFEAGFTGNVGGMNEEDDPDSYKGEYKKERDNNFRFNTSLTWQLNRPWITQLKFDASVNFNDNYSHHHRFMSAGSYQPAVHAEQEGYFLADILPNEPYFSDAVNDSKELDLAASVKYNWHKRWGDIRSTLKAGIQWKANGNVGEGEFYLDPSLAANGYRPRPYRDYPFMHNLSVYAEEHLVVPIGQTQLDLMAGVRMENVFIKDSPYEQKSTFSPRFNAKWKLNKQLSVRAGWGITEKLPSYFILYPKQEYRDILTFGFTTGNGKAHYLYYTQPYTVSYNPELRWQRNSNAELGVEATVEDFKFSLVGFYNLTKGPYNFLNVYTPYSYRILEKPVGYTMPNDPEIKVDTQNGMVELRENGGAWTPMSVKVTDRTFAKTTRQNNGADVKRAGVELVVDFPEIKPIRTTFRVDASYAYTEYLNEQLAAYYQSDWSHTYLPNRSYQYIGIYANGGSSSVNNGKITHNLDANLTTITHIPQARLIITCRLEMTILRRSRNLSEYQGRPYAFTVNELDNHATGGNIYDGNSYTAIYPVAYMDLDGNTHPFTAAHAADPEFESLILKSNNAYTFAQDGYGFYMSANLSITKEIGDHVSLSFFANNFTNARPYVKSMATGVGAIFTPAFYYGLTCRLKF